MSIDYSEISNIVSDTIAKGSQPLTDSQRIVMTGAIAVVFEKELAATKQKLEASEQAIRESQEQEPVAYLREEWLCYEQSSESDVRAFPVYTKPVIIPQSAEQLHIKELREALEIADGFMPNRGMDSICNACVDLVEKALAKQPDTRALEKALLEAEIKAIKEASTCDYNSELYSMIIEREEKLAELNKE